MHPQPFSTVRISQRVHMKPFPFLCVALLLRFILKSVKRKSIWPEAEKKTTTPALPSSSLTKVYLKRFKCHIRGNMLVLYRAQTGCTVNFSLIGNKRNIIFCVFVVEGKREKKNNWGESLLPICSSSLLSNKHQGQFHKRTNVLSHMGRQTHANKEKKTNALADTWVFFIRHNATPLSPNSHFLKMKNTHTRIKLLKLTCKHTQTHTVSPQLSRLHSETSLSLTYMHTHKHTLFPQHTRPLNHPIHSHTFSLYLSVSIGLSLTHIHTHMFVLLDLWGPPLT